MIVKYLLNILPAVFLLVVALIYLCISSTNRYVPTITISASSDGGKTYNSDLKSIPRNTDIYLKYEVSVKANGFWWRFFCNVIKFTIDFPKTFELYDYTGEREENSCIIKSTPQKYLVHISDHGEEKGDDYIATVLKAGKKKNAANSESGVYFVAVSTSDKKNSKDYNVTVSKRAKKEETFSLVASDKPKKAEILFKMPAADAGSDCSLTLSFSPPVKNVYNKTVKLDFTENDGGEKKDDISSTTKIEINNNINVQIPATG
jgi:hypothetical protein